MKKMIILSAILASSAAWAQAPSNGGANGESSFDPNQRVCMNVAETGSRLSHRRVCMTRAQWDETRRTARQDAEHTQASRNPRQY